MFFNDDICGKTGGHGLLNNVQQMGQMLDANRSGVEKVSKKWSRFITQAEDRRMYQEQVDALAREHEVALKQKHMMAGLRHLRMTFHLRQRRIVTSLAIFPRVCR